MSVPVVPILAGVLFALHVYTFFRTRKEKRATQPETKISGLSRALIVFLTVLDIAVAGILVLILSIMEPRWQMISLFILAGLLTVGLLVALMCQWFNKKRFAVWLVCAVLAVGGICGVKWYDSYIKSITLREQFDYNTYQPFREDSLVRTLEEPAALRFAEGDVLPRMDGATALYPVYAAFCQAVYPSSIAEDRSRLRDTITCSTTAWAYQKIVDGECDIIFAGGPSEEQEAYAREKGVELVFTPIGREAFVFFVHPDNPIEELSLSDIRGIYSGEIIRWEQLGVKGLGEILAYQRSEGSGSQTALKRFVMEDTPLMPAEKEKVSDGMGDIVERVSSYQNHRSAIGYSFRFYCTALMKGFDVKLLKINGAAPTVENIENGSYPLASSFYAVTRSDADENTLALLDWICGEQGQRLVKETGYTPMGAQP